MRPLAQHLGVKRIVANRLEFRDGTATGRLIEPMIRPRGAFARIREENPDGRRAPKTLARQLDISVEELRAAVIPAERQPVEPTRPIVHFEGQRQAQGFSVRRAFSGKHVMLIGVTGFIGKVWLANTLLDLPDVKRIYLLIRRQKSNPAERRFEKMVEDSPVFDPLFERHGDRLLDFLREKIEVVEGDVTQPGLGTQRRYGPPLAEEPGSDYQQLGPDGLQSRPARCPHHQHGCRSEYSRVRENGGSRRTSCISPPATSPGSRMDVSAKN